MSRATPPGSIRLTTAAAWLRRDPALEPPPWPDWIPVAARRRLDPLHRVAAHAADAALGGRRLDPATALIAGNAYGTVQATLRFAASIADHGDAGASPLHFPASTHHSTAGALAEHLGLHGPCTTVSHGACTGLAALRTAMLLLDAGRAPSVLVVVADFHHDFSRRQVAGLSAAPWPIGDGAWALLLESGPGPGRTVRLGVSSAPLTVDGGALDADDEALLAAGATGSTRLRAPERLGLWWPCATLAAVPWDAPHPIQLREAEAGAVITCWLGAPS